MSRDADRAARGDWQTPPALAREVAAALARRGLRPATVVEPTCGAGAFLCAAAGAFPGARLVGVEVDPGRLAEARASTAGLDVDLRLADFFEIDWGAELAAAPGPVLALGNPPWVTASALGALGRGAGRARSAGHGLRGLDAVTGRSNFDVAEAVVARLVGALLGRPEGFAVAALCKTSVARRVLAAAERERWAASGALWGIDARAHFGASVEACLLLVEGAPAPPAAHRWPWHERLGAGPSHDLGVAGGAVVAAPDGAPVAPPETASLRAAWRSGVKHDCAEVMELRAVQGGKMLNGLGEAVDVEEGAALPLRKCSDLARGRGGGRFVLVTQRTTGEDTARLAAASPRLWAYLAAHAGRLDARRSAVYRGRPRFCMFGVGPYTFAPYKVAVSGLHREPRFVALGPEGGLPVVLDDASYFLPFESAEAAEAAARALNGAAARAFLAARSHPGAKRPVTKALLDALTGAGAP